VLYFSKSKSISILLSLKMVERGYGSMLGLVGIQEVRWEKGGTEQRMESGLSLRDGFFHT
jgi:hypothetical protein